MFKPCKRNPTDKITKTLQTLVYAQYIYVRIPHKARSIWALGFYAPIIFQPKQKQPVPNIAVHIVYIIFNSQYRQVQQVHIACKVKGSSRVYNYTFSFSQPIKQFTFIIIMNTIFTLPAELINFSVLWLLLFLLYIYPPTKSRRCRYIYIYLLCIQNHSFNIIIMDVHRKTFRLCIRLMREKVSLCKRGFAPRKCHAIFGIYPKIGWVYVVMMCMLAIEMLILN